MDYILGVVTVPLVVLLVVGVIWGGARLRDWWTRPVSLDKVSRDRRAHVVAIVASELAAARRMRQLKLPGNVLLVIRSGGVGTDDYGWVLCDKRMRVFSNAMHGAFDKLDEQESSRSSL